MNMKLKPTHERVLIIPDPEKSETDSGILIPDDAKEPSTFGTVVDFGEKVHESISNLKIGDRVMFLKYAGMPLDIGERAHKLIMANDIIGIIIPEE